MALSFGIGDVIACSRMAWMLYDKCYIVARDAPDDFRHLVHELASLQTILRTVRDDATSNKDFFDNLGETRKMALRRCVAGSRESLSDIQELVGKYQSIGDGYGSNFWKKIKWTTEQKKIRDLRNRIMVHSTNLNLCMSSMGNNSLAQLQKTMNDALGRKEEAANSDVELEYDTAETIVDAPLIPRLQKPEDTGDIMPISRKVRSSTDATIPNNAPTTSPIPSPALSDDGRWNEAVPMARQQSAPQPSRTKHAASFSTVSSANRLSPSPRQSQDVFTNPRAGSSIAESSNTSEAQDLLEPAAPVDAAVSKALKHLALVRKAELQARPLRYPRRDELHQPDDDLKTIFKDLTAREAQYRRPNARDWLRVATWWLMKARNKMELHDDIEEPTSPTSPSSGGASRSPVTLSSQAYVDLLKVSWILYDVFLPDENLAAHLTDENRRLFYDCSHALSDDLEKLREADIPSKREIHQHNLNIWEEVQPEETSEDDDLLLGRDNGRWISANKSEAGEEDERVLFRTFVNAVIGPRGRAVRSRGWPYLLILSSQEGESEPKVTLCNQSGSLGITRDFTPKDIVEPDLSVRTSTGRLSRSVGTEDVPLNFGELKVKISFSNEADLSRFMDIPMTYFDAVKEREPRSLSNATETLIFRRPVESFEKLQADTMRSRIPKEAHSSCDLRILETSSREGWKVTRRLVLSSSVGHKRPWSKSYFLPISRVQLQHDISTRRVKAKWSDYLHLMTRRDGSMLTNGEYNPVYTYIYDENNPNRGIELQFCTQADAKAFETATLSLSHQAQFEWSTGDNRNYIYMIQDSDPNPKEYKGMIIQRTRANWKFAEFFFMYRDSDYDYNQDRMTVFFPQLLYPNYVSSHVKELFAPTAENPVQFSHCEKKIGDCALDFDREETSQAFMSALTQHHELRFSRRIAYIDNKKPAKKLFGQSQWKARGQAELQLWWKGNSYRLVTRWAERASDKDRWVSMSLPRGGIDTPNNGSNLIVLPPTEYERGKKIDMANLKARDPADIQSNRLEAPFTFAFKLYKDREEFLTVLNGTKPDDIFNPLF